jgi:hypothetical protein
MRDHLVLSDHDHEDRTQDEATATAALPCVNGEIGPYVGRKRFP